VGNCAAKSKFVFESTFNRALFFRGTEHAAFYEMSTPVPQRIMGIPVPNVSTEKAVIDDNIPVLVGSVKISPPMDARCSME
jgi:hypothetical protein